MHAASRVHRSHDEQPLPRFGTLGDVCAVPGCGTRLSPYNVMDTCERCQKRGTKPHVRPRAVCSEEAFDAVPGFMESPRRPTREECEVAAQERRRAGEAKQLICTYLTGLVDWAGCKQIAEACSLRTSVTTTTLQRLFEAGALERRPAGNGRHGHHYRAREDVAAKCERDDGPVAPDPFPAPADLPEPDPDTREAPVTQGQPPADEAAATDSTQWPPPFAGTTVSSTGDGVCSFFCESSVHDHEAKAIDDCVQALGGIRDSGGRDRVLAYLVARFAPEWK